MEDVTIRAIDDCEYYQGPGAIPGIRFHSLGKALGISAWGMNALEIEAGCAGYPEHDHIEDEQEETYVILKGSAVLVTPEGEVNVREGMAIRVGPTTRRKFLAGKEGLTLLALGGTPGKAYGT